MTDRSRGRSLAYRPWASIPDYATAADAAKCSRWAAGYVVFGSVLGAALSYRSPFSAGCDLVEATVGLLLLSWVWNPPKIAASALTLALVGAEIVLHLLAIFAPHTHTRFDVGWLWIHLIVCTAAVLGLRGSVYMKNNRSPQEMSLVF